MGAVRPSGTIPRGKEKGIEVDGRPFAFRNTIPANPDPPMPPEAKTGQRARATLEMGSRTGHEPTPTPPATVVIEEATRQEPPASVARPRQGRDPIRVDDLSSKRTTIRGPVGIRPRVVDASRVAHAPLDTRHAFVLQLIDGMLTPTELADASGFAQEEVDQILARLVRLAIIAM